MGRYVALKRLRFGDAHLAPGDEVPDEPGRNYNLMVMRGDIADIDQKERTEDEAQATIDALRTRVTQLEELLAASNEELAALRKGEPDAEKGDLTPDGQGEDATKGDEPAPRSEGALKRLNKEQLLEIATEADVFVPEGATNADIIALLVEELTPDGQGED